MIIMGMISVGHIGNIRLTTMMIPSTIQRTLE